MVHQAGKIKEEIEQKRFLKWLYDFEFNLYKIPVPDKVFFLNMPVEFSLKLMENRKNKFDENERKDIHERDVNHLKDSYEAACKVAKDYNWDEIKCVLNGNIRTKEDIADEIFERVKSIII